MDRKVIMGVAAVAGIGLLLYMRKSGDQATLAGSASIVGSASAPWSSQPIVINATTKPLPVSDAAAATPAPAPKPPPAPAPSTYQPWESAAAAPAVWGGDGWKQASGAPVSDGYAFNHLTPDQLKGKDPLDWVRRLTGNGG
jgi:hypothetical protein